MTSGDVFWRTISLATQGSLGREATRLLFEGLLVASLAVRGNAQASNPENLQNVSLSLDGAPAMGDEKAHIAIVEFGDYQCPYCAQHAIRVLPWIVADYVKTGKVRYFFKDFPIEAIHQQAFKAAQAARCAGEQGKYWEMHDRLFKDQHSLGVKALPTHALALGLDVPSFQQCLNSGTCADQVRKDIQEGWKNNVSGTPEFFLGTLDTLGSTMKVVTMLDGAQPYSAFRQALDQMLSPPNDQRRTGPSREGFSLV